MRVIMLEQHRTDGRWHPVAFFSRKLQGSSGMQNYTYREKDRAEFEKQAGDRWGRQFGKRGYMLWDVISSNINR